MHLYHGNIVFSKDRETLAVHKDSWIAVKNGAVEGIYASLPEKLAGAPLTDYGDSVLIPAFSDLHVHAPQYPQRGLGMDLLLADWLNTYVQGKVIVILESCYAGYAIYSPDVQENGIKENGMS